MNYLQDLPQKVSGDDNAVNELISLTTQFDFDEVTKKNSSPGGFFLPYNAQFALGNVKWW